MVKHTNFVSRFKDETIFSKPEAEQWHELGWWGENGTPELLERNADLSPNSTALRDDSRSMTWAELDEAAERFGRALAARGVTKGDRVAYQIPDCIEWFVVRHGINKVGGVATTLFPRFRRKELSHVLSTTEPKVVVGMASYKDYEHVSIIDDLRDEVDPLEHVVLLGDNHEIPEWAEQYDILMEEDPADVDVSARRIHPDYPNALATTSGTTGLPKVYYVPQNARLVSARWWQTRYCVTPNDKILVLMPIQHAAGAVWAFYVGLRSKATVQVTNANEPEEMWECIESWRPSVVFAAPTQMTKMINHESALESLSFVRCLANGGAPLPPEIAAQFDSLGTITLNAYGAGDGGTPIAVCPVESPEIRRTTVGKAQPDAEVLVVNEEGEETAPNEAGELLFRGPDRLFGYYDNPEQTNETFGVGGPREDWFHTGDAGMQDEEGNITVVGRLDDMILRGGRNIFPTEVEDELLKTGLVNEVAVIGMPDPEYNERVCAYVTTDDPTLSLDDITDALDDQGLAKFKWPERLEVVDELPKSSGGKIKKAELRNDIEQKVDG